GIQIDVLEDATSVTTASKITGLPVSVGSTIKYTIDTGGPALDRAHVSPVGAGAPANIAAAFGVLSFRVNSGAVNLPVRITSSVPFGNSPQFYKVNAAGVYSVIPLSNINIVSSTVVDIILTDGGALDLDGTVDGFIVDPIAIGSAPQVLGTSGSGGGGCALVQSSEFDPLMPLLLLFSVIYLWRQRRELSEPA
ncbi:MAG: choice-of-anchor U domain-containing protein, partial [Mariprofundus sp.]